MAVLAALAYGEATRSPVAIERARRWAEEIYASRFQEMLPDRLNSSEIHLWGHLQECALADAGAFFSRPDWVETARLSAERLLVAAVQRKFPARTSIAFDVSCAVRGLEAVGRATGDRRYEAYADLGRAWFAGRNAASEPVFDRRRGLVYDGIDDGRLNLNSGAESNIEAGLALVNSSPRLSECSGKPL